MNTSCSFATKDRVSHSSPLEQDMHPKLGAAPCWPSSYHALAAVLNQPELSHEVNQFNSILKSLLGF